MFTPVSPTSCPGSTSPSSPTEGLPPATIPSLLCLFEVIEISLALDSLILSEKFIKFQVKFFQEMLDSQLQEAWQ